MFRTICGAATAAVALVLTVAVSSSQGTEWCSPQVSAGVYHSCELRPDCSVACWGRDLEGQTDVPAAAFTQVSVGRLHTCSLGAGGAVSCWGDDSHFQSSPPAGAFAQVAAGGDHTCALRSDGSAACWGYDASGEATPPSGTFTQLSAGPQHNCAIRTSGTVACWGENDAGESTPADGTFVQVSAGGDHTCGLRASGAVVCWGRSLEGQLTPPAGTFTQVAAGGYHTCALRSDGSIVCWGYDGYGQAAPPSGAFVHLASGYFHTCGVRPDDTVECWGYDGYGQATPPQWITQCGDGVVQPGEQCDDGNTVDGDCCGATCHAESAGGPCTADANPCTDDVCDGLGACSHPANSQPCDDGLYCTVGDVCSGGACAGTARDCGDGDVCTDDSCNDSTDACVHRSNSASCDDGLFCTVGDVCSGGACAGTARDCSDGNVCTDDSCNDSTDACVHENNAASCDDGLYCTVGDACSAGSCGGSPRSCSDGNVCTDDSCNDLGDACVHENNTASCDDGLYCTVDDGCSGGSCGGAARDCDDGELCTDDSCDDLGDACVHQDNTLSCDDGLYCTVDDACSGGACTGATRDCADAEPCTADSCDEDTRSCVHRNADIACDDGLYCTVEDTCSDGVCAGVARDCDDGDVCTDDTCDEGGATCRHGANTAACDDAVFCNGVDRCAGGSCSVHAGDPCSQWPVCSGTCDELQRQCLGVVGSPCDDGDLCTAGDSCSAPGVCTSGTPTACDDGEPCTQDSCDPASGACVYSQEPQRRTDDATSPGTCRVAANAATVISVTRRSSKIKWKWQQGESTDLAALGDPMTDTVYTLCIYDQSGGVFRSAQPDPDLYPAAGMGIDVSAGQGWAARGSQGFWYRNRSCDQEGIAGLSLLAAEDGRARAALKAVGACLPAPMPFSEEKFFDFDGSVVIQLVNSRGECWDATFDASTSIRRNDGKRFKSKAVVRVTIP